MGSLTDFLTEYQGPIQGLYETGSDVKSTNNLEKYLNDLDVIKKDSDRVQKFSDITNKLSRIDTNTLPRTKKVQKEALDTDAIKTYGEEFKKTGLYNDYSKYLEGIQEKDDKGQPVEGKYSETPKDIHTYLQEHPMSEEHMKELREKSFYKPKEYDATMTPDEIIDTQYKMAGLSPEDRKWFEAEMKSKDDNDPKNLNKKIMRMVAERIPGLMSEGTIKNKYAEMFGNEASTYLIDQPSYTEQKKKKLDDYSTSELKGFTADQLLNNFNSSDVYKHIMDYPEDVRNKIYEKFPNWKEEEKKKWTQSDIDKLTLDDLEKMSTDDIDAVYNFLPVEIKKQWEAKHIEQDDPKKTGGRHRVGSGTSNLPDIKTGVAFDNVYKYVTGGGDKPSELKGWTKEGIGKLKELIGKEYDDVSAKKHFQKIWDEAGKYNAGTEDKKNVSPATLLGWKKYQKVQSDNGKTPDANDYMNHVGNQIKSKYKDVDGIDKAVETVKQRINDIITAYHRL